MHDTNLNTLVEHNLATRALDNTDLFALGHCESRTGAGSTSRLPLFTGNMPPLWPFGPFRSFRFIASDHSCNTRRGGALGLEVGVPSPRRSGLVSALLGIAFAALAVKVTRTLSWPISALAVEPWPVILFPWLALSSSCALGGFLTCKLEVQAASTQIVVLPVE